MEITAPKVLEPSVGARVAADAQPVSLLIENASSSGVRPLSYVFEVATDAGFTNKVFSREAIAPGEGGRTTLRLPDPLASGRSYFWHARAEDGANTGPFSAAANFAVFTPIVIEAPEPIAPAMNATLGSLRPPFVVNNARHSGPVGALSYTLEIADSFTFANKVATMTIGEQPNQTRFDLNTDLKYSSVYYWHVRAGDSSTAGPFRAWSPLLPRVPAPEPIPPPTGGGAGGGDAGDFAWSKVRIIGGSPDVRSWPITASITSLSMSGGTFHLDYTKRCQWPGVDIGGALQEATIWMFEKIGGQWWMAPAQRLRPCQADKALARPSDIASGFYSAQWAPMTGYVPARGETVGFMVTAGSTRATRGRRRKSGPAWCSSRGQATAVAAGRRSSGGSKALDLSSSNSGIR